jgi:hypothetical protein
LLSKNVNIKIYKTIILPVPYGFEARSITLSEEHRVRVFENRVVRRIFGPKRDEVTGGRRKLNVEACMVQMRNAYKIFVQTAEGKRPFGRCRRRWEDNIKMDL